MPTKESGIVVEVPFKVTESVPPLRCASIYPGMPDPLPVPERVIVVSEFVL
jgi:hypothetical protein